jgi:hypothetical protein
MDVGNLGATLTSGPEGMRAVLPASGVVVFRAVS